MGRSSRLLVAAGAGMLLACNAIIGLSDFEKRECAGKDPCPFDGGPDVETDTFRPDAGTDAKPDAPPGVGPVSWADFPMPNTKPDSGAFPGVDPRPLDYGVIDGDQVTDNVTGLVWRRAVVGAGSNNYTEAQAMAECVKLGSWRVPKRIELVTLLSHGLGGPYVNRDIFTVPNAKVWTSSEVRTADGVVANKYWVVDFEIGAVAERSATDTAQVLCVKDK